MGFFKFVFWVIVLYIIYKKLIAPILKKLSDEARSLQQGSSPRQTQLFEPQNPINSPKPEGLYGKALALAEQGEWEKAVEAFEAVLKKEPNLIEAWINRGRALGFAGRKSECYASLEKARRLAEDQKDFEKSGEIKELLRAMEKI